MENLRRKTISAFFWEITGRFASQGISIIVTIILARLVAPEEFGSIAVVLVLILFAGVIVDMGFSAAIIQRNDLTNTHYSSIFFLNITSSVILSLILFSFAGMVARYYENDQLQVVIRVLSASFFINSFSFVPRSLLQKNLEYRKITLANLISIITSGVTGISLALLGYGIWALVFQNLMNALAGTIVLLSLSGWKPNITFQGLAIKSIWPYTSRMFVTAFLDAVFTQSDQLIIGKFFSFKTLGFYYRAKSLDQFIKYYTSGAISSVMFSSLSKIHEEKERYLNVIYKSFHLINLGAFFLSGFLFLCGTDIILILFGIKWLPSAIYFKIIMITGFVVPISELLMLTLSTKGDSKAFLRVEVIKKGLLGLNLIVGFRFGVIGFLYGLLIVNLFSLALNIQFASAKLEVSPSWFYKTVFQYLPGTSIVCIGLSVFSHFVTLTNPWLHLTIMSCLFIGLFAAFNYILNTEGFVLSRNAAIRIYNENLKDRLTSLFSK